MNTTVTSRPPETIDAVQQMPCVTIVLPFNPGMSPKKEILATLKSAADSAELELHQKFPEEVALLLMYRLHAMILDLNFHTNKKSIVIFVSPMVDKLLYLDMPVNPTVKVASSFSIKEVISCKKQLKQYLLLQTTRQGFKIFVGSEDGLVKIVSAPYTNPGQTLSTDTEQAAVAAIQHIDQTLDIILDAYNMPLLAATAADMSLMLQQHSRFAGHFTSYLTLPQEDISPYYLQQLAATNTADWEQIIAKHLHNSMTVAAAQGKLITGITPVVRAVMRHQSKLLILERDTEYQYAASTSEEVIRKAIQPYHSFSYISNITDEMIEKVLEDGGDVEFVASNSLSQFEHIALIKK